MATMQGQETKGIHIDMTNSGYAAPPAQPPQYYPPTQQTVVVPHPQGPPLMYMAREGDQVQDNMVIAIVSIFFCCIIGIIATLKASNANDSARRGAIERAQKETESARKLAIAAIITGIVISVILIFVLFILPFIITGAIIGANS